jgi:hypothetical protein
MLPPDDYLRDVACLAERRGLDPWTATWRPTHRRRWAISDASGTTVNFEYADLQPPSPLSPAGRAELESSHGRARMHEALRRALAEPVPPAR